MGSVLDQIQCPNCKNDADREFYYKSGEEHVFCRHCGYSMSVQIMDGKWERNELKDPYGSYRVKHYNSIGIQIGSLKDQNDYISLVTECTGATSIEYFSVSRFVDGIISEEVIIVNGLTYADHWDGDASASE